MKVLISVLLAVIIAGAAKIWNDFEEESRIRRVLESQLCDKYKDVQEIYAIELQYAKPPLWYIIYKTEDGIFCNHYIIGVNYITDLGKEKYNGQYWGQQSNQAK